MEGKTLGRLEIQGEEVPCMGLLWGTFPPLLVVGGETAQGGTVTRGVSKETAMEQSVTEIILAAIESAVNKNLDFLVQVMGQESANAGNVKSGFSGETVPRTVPSSSCLIFA